jgi:hypothetical protein
MVTLLDVQLARLLFPLLAEIARRGQPVSAQQLVYLAQAHHRDDRRVGHLSALRVPRILTVIMAFANRHELPDLTRMISVGRTPVSASVLSVQQRCVQIDWLATLADFNLYGAQLERTHTPAARRPREAATQLMSEFYLAHREPYAKAMRYFREVIIDNIVNGMEVEQAFEIEARLLEPTAPTMIDVRRRPGQ